MNVEQVKAFQEKLKEAGFYTGAVDGLWGPKTKLASKLYEQQNRKVFTPPVASAQVLKGLDFSEAFSVAQENKAVFDAFDQEGAKNDPSNCKTILRFPGGPVFWSSKMAIDADGPDPDGAGPMEDGIDLDPDSGQNDTSYHLANGQGLSSELVNYVVLPGGSFSNNTKLSLGDVGVVVFADKITWAILGDKGPIRKIGEASIGVHKSLMPRVPDPCIKKDDKGRCIRIRNSSVESNVLYFFFPGEGFGEKSLKIEDINSVVGTKALALFNSFLNSSV